MGSFHRPGMKLIASHELTGGAFEIVEDTRDAGEGPPPHEHRGRQESFYVLEGRFTFTSGHEELEAAPGAFVHIPAGTRHCYRAEIDRSRLLFFVVPAGLADFLTEASQRMAAGSTALEAMTALSGTYDAHPVD